VLHFSIGSSLVVVDERHFYPRPTYPAVNTSVNFAALLAWTDG